MLVSACKKETTESDAPAEDASSTPNAEAIDPALAEAVAAASATAAPAAEGPGPPAQGIFAPGQADKEAAKGAPFKVVLGSAGDAPRAAITPPVPVPGQRTKGKLTLASQGSLGGAPLAFELAFEAKKPDAEGSGATPVSAKVVSAQVAVGGAPKEIERLVAGLKGSKVDFLVQKDGAGTDFALEVPKTAPAEYRDILDRVQEALALFMVPVPTEPVGVGAFWMVTSRQGILGLDLVTYRLVKVTSAGPQGTALSISTKRYAAQAEFDLAGLPPDMPRELSDLKASEEGSLTLAPGSGFARSGKNQSSLRALVGSETDRKALEFRGRADLTIESKTAPAP